MNKIVYLNNEYLPENQATISIFDRGFLFADGVYEVIPVYEHNVILLEEHLIRLQDNINKLQIHYLLKHDEWLDICNKLIATNGPNSPIYIQITRGCDKTRRHDFPTNLVATKLALSLDPVQLGSSLSYGLGNSKNLQIITLPDNRWNNCDVKSIALLGNILLRQEGLKQNAEEVLLVREGDHVVEGTSCNFFMVKDNRVSTPPLGNQILPGITRRIVINICLANNINIVEKNITQTELGFADEIWLTSSTKEIRPATILNGKLINNGKPGPIWQKVAGHYVDYIKKLM